MLKYADVQTVKKMTRVIWKSDTLSKVYERIIYNQMDPHLDTLFSNFQYGLRGGFNAQHCLISMVR